jgi:hypothetical protein
MFTKNLKIIIPALVLFVPVLVMAQQPNAQGLFNLLGMATALIQGLIPFVIGLALLSFLWGVLKYATAKDEEEQKKSKGFMLYGIIGLFVMVSVWGLVNLLGDTLNLSNATPTAPRVPEVSR